jgi:hypothetical protein
VTSLSCQQSRVWNDDDGDNHAAHVVSSRTASDFLTNMSEEHKSTSPSATQVKNRQKTISIEEKLSVINQHENVNELLMYIVPLHSLIVAYIQFVIMLIELKTSGKNVFVQQAYHSLIRMNHAKSYRCESLTFLLYQK